MSLQIIPYVQRNGQRFFNSLIPVTVYRKNGPISLKDGVLLRSKSVRTSYQRIEKRIELPIYSQVPIHRYGRETIVEDTRFLAKTVFVAINGFKTTT